MAGLVAALIMLEMAAVGYYATRTAHLEAIVARQQSEAAAEAQVLADLVKALDLDLA